jgi:hypothetical protein
MKIKYLLFLSLFLGLGVNSYALNQEDVDDIKFQSTSFVLNFLKITVYKQACEGVESYNEKNIDSLSKAYDCIQNNKKLIVDPIYNKLLNDNKIEDFFVFVKELPVASKPKRKETYNDEYASFVIELDKLKEQYTSEPVQYDPPQKVNSTPPLNEIPEDDVKKPKATSNLLLYGISGLALLLSGLALFLISQLRIQNKLKQQFFIDEMKAIRNELVEKKPLSNKNPEDNNVIRNLENNIKSLEQRFNDVLKKQTAQALKAAEIIKKEDPRVERKVAIPEPKQLPFRQYYARFADDEGFFSSSFLKNNPDGQSVFELRVRENGTGEFVITTDSAIQKNVALTSFDRLLSKTCNFTAYPNSETTRIVTKSPGVIKLIEDRWLIVTKATIELI